MKKFTQQRTKRNTCQGIRIILKDRVELSYFEHQTFVLLIQSTYRLHQIVDLRTP